MRYSGRIDFTALRETGGLIPMYNDYCIMYNV
jgi:hypothetical protein